MGADGLTLGPEMLTRVQAGEPPAAGQDEALFHSRGTVLVCGPAVLAVAAGKLLAKELRVVVCATDEVVPSDIRANPLVMRSRVAAISGHLGRFVAKAWAGEGILADLGPFSGNPDHCFDLVLDLNRTPLLEVELKPPGYQAPGWDGRKVGEAIADLSRLTGTFRKSAGCHYDRARCAHAAQGISGCRRCLDICPAGALSSSGGAIHVDAGLCQGCGACMLACPSGALSHPQLSPARVLAALAERLEQSLAEGDPVSRLVIGEESSLPRPLPETPADGAIILPLPRLAAAGPELWLTALAAGIPQVVIRVPAGLPAATRRQLAFQVQSARNLLAALGEAPDRLSLDDGSDGPPCPEVAAPAPPRPIPRVGDKREAIQDAIDRLAAVHGETASSGPRTRELPPGAPFGAVRIDASSCTLCLACANICPTGALRSSNAQATRTLSLAERDCLQCHICEQACPEQALSLHPRLLLDAGARHGELVLREEIQHRCPQCGIPFPDPELLLRNIRSLEGPGRLNPLALDHLRHCPDCRLGRVTGSHSRSLPPAGTEPAGRGHIPQGGAHGIAIPDPGDH